ncbi:MAG: alanine--tRNA ligase, partial [Acidobacteriota bacterium]
SPVEGVTLHRVRVDQDALEAGQIVVAEVDAERRAGARRHHTATHLVHAALRQVLGTHVRQAGSLVAPDRLRFDFSHFEAISSAAQDEIESLANEVAIGDLPVETREMDLDAALAAGARAFFGDRYGERVRVVSIGEFSLELCGGTHVGRTGEIGPLLIVAERGVAAGVRRVEAVTGPEAMHLVRRERGALSDASRALGVARSELGEGLERKLETLKKLQKENEQLRMRLAHGAVSAQQQETAVDGVSVLTREVDELNRGQRRDLADSLRQKNPSAVIVLGAREEGKAALLVAVGRAVAARVDARALVRSLGSIVGGGGGGRADLAEAGGRHPDKLASALAAAPEAVRKLLAG